MHIADTEAQDSGYGEGLAIVRGTSLWDGTIEVTLSGDTESAWAAVRTKNCYLSAQFKRLAVRRGSKRALIAVAHSLLVIGYHIQSEGCVYQELGGNFFDQLHAERLKRHLVKRLESLGVSVTLQPQGR